MRRAKRLRLQAPMLYTKPLPDRVDADQSTSGWEIVKRIGAVALVVGISVLTVIGLHAFYTEISSIPSPLMLCPSNPLSCPEHDKLLQGALVT